MPGTLAGSHPATADCAASSCPACTARHSNTKSHRAFTCRPIQDDGSNNCNLSRHISHPVRPGEHRTSLARSDHACARLRAASATCVRNLHRHGDAGAVALWEGLAARQHLSRARCKRVRGSSPRRWSRPRPQARAKLLPGALRGVDVAPLQATLAGGGPSSDAEIAAATQVAGRARTARMAPAAAPAWRSGLGATAVAGHAYVCCLCSSRPPANAANTRPTPPRPLWQVVTACLACCSHAAGAGEAEHPADSDAGSQGDQGDEACGRLTVGGRACAPRVPRLPLAGQHAVVLRGACGAPPATCVSTVHTLAPPPGHRKCANWRRQCAPASQLRAAYMSSPRVSRHRIKSSCRRRA